MSMLTLAQFLKLRKIHVVPFSLYLKWSKEGLPFDEMVARWQSSPEHELEYQKLLEKYKK